MPAYATKGVSMRTYSLLLAVTAPFALAALGWVSPDPAIDQTAAAEKKEAELETVDYFVPHISTVPANEGEEVELFVRERFLRGEEKNNGKFHKDKCRRKGPVVLMVHGAYIPSVACYDLDFADYSWMSFLAENCFDVFTMDLQGYGRSTRPKMDDPCNASLADQKQFLIPNPLKTTCPPSYSLPVEGLKYSFDQMDTVVDYIRGLRKDDDLKINIVGWSRGGTRAIGYAAAHPDKVDKLVLFGAGRIPPPPAQTVAMKIYSKDTVFGFWDGQLDPENCPDTFDPAIRDSVWSTMLDFDDLGSTWGAAGVSRNPGLNPLGWDSNLPSMVTAPSLVIRGALDTIADKVATQKLYDDLGSSEKVLLTVGCATHALPWEKKHTILFDATVQWLTSGTYNGHSTGSFLR